MASTSAHSSEPSRDPAQDREQRLNEVIAAYLEALEAGAPADRSALLTQFPELAGELALFFNNQDDVARLTAPLREADGKPPGGRRTEDREKDPVFNFALPAQPWPLGPSLRSSRRRPSLSRASRRVIAVRARRTPAATRRANPPRRRPTRASIILATTSCSRSSRKGGWGSFTRPGR